MFENNWNVAQNDILVLIFGFGVRTMIEPMKVIMTLEDTYCLLRNLHVHM